MDFIFISKIIVMPAVAYSIKNPRELTCESVFLTLLRLPNKSKWMQ